MTVTNQVTLREYIWTTATQTIRMQGIIPTKKLVSRICQAAANSYRSSSDISSLNKVTVARDVTNSIMRNWDFSKARPIAKVPRSTREALDDLIISKLRINTSDERSVRDVAAELNLSASRVQRAVAKSGLRKSVPKKHLSLDAQSVLSVIRYHMPQDGKRAFDVKMLMSAAYVDYKNAAQVFSEINGSRTSTYIRTTEMASIFGSNWAVVSRGRTLSQYQAEVWLQKADYSRLHGIKDTQKPDQRKFVVEINVPPLEPVQADLLAVLRVAYGSRSLTQWRRFIQASVPTVIDTVPIDREALVTVVQSMLRLTEKDTVQALTSATRWVVNADGRDIAKQLFDFSRLLIVRSDMDSSYELIMWWSDFVGYRHRIAEGSIPGRTERAFDVIMHNFDDNDPSWLVVLPAELGDLAVREPEWHVRPDIPAFLRE